MPFPAPGDLPDPGIELEALASSALAGGFFTTGATWEAPRQEWRQKKTIKSLGKNMVAQKGVKAIEVVRCGGGGARARFRKQNWQNLAMDRARRSRRCQV